MEASIARPIQAKTWEDTMMKTDQIESVLKKCDRGFNSHIDFEAVEKVDEALAKADGGKSTYQITQELRQEMREG